MILFIYHHGRNISYMTPIFRNTILLVTTRTRYFVYDATNEIFRDTILLVASRNVQMQYNIVCVSPRTKYSMYSATNEIFLDAILLVMPRMRYSVAYNATKYSAYCLYITTYEIFCRIILFIYHHGRNISYTTLRTKYTAIILLRASL